MRSSGIAIKPKRPVASSRKAALVRCAEAFLWLALLAPVVYPTRLSAGSAMQREYEIKAAYLYNFINYVEWPEDAFPPAGGAITIGIVGSNPFGAALDVLNGKQIKGRAVALKQITDTKDLSQCQIVFISASEKQRLPDLLEKLKDLRVLTVSEMDGFAERGGIINFISERNKVRFEINPDAARRLGLNISSELLKLAKVVKS